MHSSSRPRARQNQRQVATTGAIVGLDLDRPAKVFFRLVHAAGEVAEVSKVAEQLRVVGRKGQRAGEVFLSFLQFALLGVDYCQAMIGERVVRSLPQHLSV